MLLHFLLGVLIVVGVVLTVIILFQRSEGGALGMGGGGQFMSARGAGDLLTRTTQVLAAVFFVLSLTITILTGRSTGTAAAISDLNVEDIDTSTATQPAPAGSLEAPPATVGGGPLGSSAPAPTQTTPALPSLGSLSAPAAPAPAAPAP